MSSTYLGQGLGLRAIAFFSKYIMKRLATAGDNDDPITAPIIGHRIVPHT